MTRSREQMRAIEKDSRVDVREATEKVWRVLRGPTFLGWFIEDEVVGKHEFITWALATAHLYTARSGRHTVGAAA